MVALVPQDRMFGLIIGPVFWAAYFVLSYVISGVGCSLGYDAHEFAGANLIRLLILGVGAFIALLIIACGVQALRGRSRARQNAARTSDDEAWRHQFLYGTSLTLCVLSLVGTIWLAMNALLTPVC